MFLGEEPLLDINLGRKEQASRNNKPGILTACQHRAEDLDKLCTSAGNREQSPWARQSTWPFLSVADFLGTQLFLSGHSQYIKISALSSRGRGVAGKTVNSSTEQMIIQLRSPFVLRGGGYKFSESICCLELLCIHHASPLHHS